MQVDTNVSESDIGDLREDNADSALTHSRTACSRAP